MSFTLHGAPLSWRSENPHAVSGTQVIMSVAVRLAHLDTASYDPDKQTAIAQRNESGFMLSTEYLDAYYCSSDRR